MLYEVITNRCFHALVPAHDLQLEGIETVQPAGIPGPKKAIPYGDAPVLSQLDPIARIQPLPDLV